jgi:hypothetical protein
MIQFNELRVDSNKNLIVDASILDLTIDPSHQITFESIKVGFNSNIELDEYIDNIDDDSIFPRKDYDSTSGNPVLRGFRMVLDLNTFEKTNNLIYIKLEADVSAVDITSTDCTLNTFIEGYAYDKCLLMNKVFDYIKATDGTCESIGNYANYIVKVNGLRLAVESGNFALASLYWNKFFANKNNNIGLISNTGCGCRQ